MATARLKRPRRSGLASLEAAPLRSLGAAGKIDTAARQGGGRKRRRFISPLQTPLLYNSFEVYSPINIDKPDLNRYPLFAQATVMEVIVEPSELVRGLRRRLA